MRDKVHLGLDTGGTFTDAVLYDEGRGLIAKAKALTTRRDLSVGIAEAAGKVLDHAGLDADGVGLVCLSTTLATNALVEGHQARVALVLIGFTLAELQRDGLGEALGDGPVIVLQGGHDVHGRETPLDMAPLRDKLEGLAGEVEAVAVAGYFAVRNPAHELAVRDLVRQKTGLAVTCSHELSSKLGGPRRALTTLLNARLIGLIERLIGATERFLEKRGIDAPLMIVRGDGALIAAAEARLRPIETILSGPAASLVGARHLTGLDDAVVSDIGGTTTDVATLQAGRPRLDNDGALVGGYRTMVEAVAMRTTGLGGDSEIGIERDGIRSVIAIGPRRAVPLSLAAHLHEAEILGVLNDQLRAPQPGRHDGRFAMLAHDGSRGLSALSPRERALHARLSEKPQPLDMLLRTAAERAAMDRLVMRGLATLIAFTPSDAMHVLSRQTLWNGEAARLGAELMARRRGATGEPVACSPEDFSRLVADRMTLLSSHAVLESALAEDEARSGEGTTVDAARNEVVRRALLRAPGMVRFSLGMSHPLVALGASASVHYPAVATMLGAQGVIPEHADVANALGAVVGQVRVKAEVFVTAPGDDRFAVTGIGTGIGTGTGPGNAAIFPDEQAAMVHARAVARQEAGERARRAGTGAPAVTLEEHVTAPEVDGRRRFMEAVVRAVAVGRPRVAEA